MTDAPKTTRARKPAAAKAAPTKTPRTRKPKTVAAAVARALDPFRRDLMAGVSLGAVARAIV